MFKRKKNALFDKDVRIHHFIHFSRNSDDFKYAPSKFPTDS